MKTNTTVKVTDSYNDSIHFMGLVFSYYNLLFTCHGFDAVIECGESKVLQLFSKIFCTYLQELIENFVMHFVKKVTFLVAIKSVDEEQ